MHCSIELKEVCITLNNFHQEITTFTNILNVRFKTEADLLWHHVLRTDGWPLAPHLPPMWQCPAGD